MPRARPFISSFSKVPVAQMLALHTGAAGRRSEAKLLRKPDLVKRPDTEPVDIQLIPGEAVSNGSRIGAVVVVPAFAKCQ